MENTSNNDKTLSNIDKIKALFLNKIEGLNWYYFEIDFNESLGEDMTIKPASSNEFQDLLDNITMDMETGRYQYNVNAVPKPTTGQIFHLLLAYIKKNPEIIGAVTKRIFDIKENEILNESEAFKGIMGKFNISDENARNKTYINRIKKFKRDENHFVILAEGDSWFEFPKIFFGARFIGKDIVKDILDWIIEDEHYAVYSLSAGGDWLSNMMYMGEYIPELPKVSPDAFLISGGGNDMVGDHRLATMVVNQFLVGKRKPSETHIAFLINKRSAIPTNKINLDKYKLGLELIADDFYNFLNICMAQYFLYFYNINSSREYDNMIFITQGYDFAIPSEERHNFLLSAQHLENAFLNSGKWLFEALQMKGVTDPIEQRAVVYTCIYEFNEMLISLAQYQGFKNVYHIDNRGVAKTEDAWFDELHLKSEYFEKVASAYKKCINDNARRGKKVATQKVYWTLNEANNYLP